MTMGLNSEVVVVNAEHDSEPGAFEPQAHAAGSAKKVSGQWNTVSSQLRAERRKLLIVLRVADVIGQFDEWTADLFNCIDGPR